MNNEIKEILRDLEFASGVFDYTITPDRCTFLKDYITNLQHTIKDNEDTLIDKNECINLLETQLTNLQTIEREYSAILSENAELQQRIEGLEAENETLRSDFKNQVEYTNKIAEENERLKEILKGQENLTLSYCKSEQDYKSRCEKSSGDIKDIFKDEDWYKNYDYNDLANTLKNVLNILQNGSDKNV